METANRLVERQIASGGRVEVPGDLLQWLERPKGLHLGGREVAAADGRTFTDVNPATEAPLAEIALAGESDVDAAVQQAARAFDEGRWRDRPLSERADVLHAIADTIDRHRGLLAVLESLDTGKPIQEAYHGDIPRAAHNFRFFADYARHQENLYFSGGPDQHFAFREPLGVAALITPWNLPLYLETWKLAPALVMGNSVVLKPSELTPLTAAFLAERIEAENLLPPGVLNVIHGFGDRSTGEFLVSHPRVDAISFTGETRTGSAIMRSAAGGPTKVSFELGGKGASVVFADAPLETAVRESARAAFRNQGEICLACPRIFVHRSRYEEFLEAFCREVDRIRVGDPLDTGTTMGALISREHHDKVTGYLGKVADPGRILRGGNRPDHCPRGFYLAPTVVVGLGTDHPISREEVFGPVVSLYAFDDEAQVIRDVNDTPYGLSASLWTADLDRANRVARRFRHGLVWINCWFVRDLRVPFGGQKKSGVGREGGRYSLDFFSEWKSVCIRTGEA